MDKHLDWQKILRYLNGDSSYTEKLEMAKWIKESPENEEFIQFLEMIWQMEPSKRKDIDSELAWERFAKRYSFDDEKKSEEASLRDTKLHHFPASKSHKPRRRYNWVRYAVVAATFLVAILVSLQLTNSSLLSESELAVEIEREYREYNTQRGQRTRIILTNGSVIHLNGESSLRIPKTLREGEDIDVYLDGEAYFIINNNADDVRFRVYAGETVTTVLGTSFNVKSYEEDAEVTVVVASGRVSFGTMGDGDRQAAILTKSYKGIISNGGSPEVSYVEDLNIYYGWTEGELIFESENLSQMKTRLERWFGIEIQVDSLAENVLSNTLTASFSERQPVEDVLQSISLVLDLSFEKVENETAVNTFKFYQ